MNSHDVNGIFALISWVFFFSSKISTFHDNKTENRGNKSNIARKNRKERKLERKNKKPTWWTLKWCFGAQSFDFYPSFSKIFSSTYKPKNDEEASNRRGSAPYDHSAPPWNFSAKTKHDPFNFLRPPIHLLLLGWAPLWALVFGLYGRKKKRKIILANHWIRPSCVLFCY